MTTPPASLPSPYSTGLGGRCPRCGEGKLFDGYLKLRPRCPSQRPLPATHRWNPQGAES